MTTFFKKLGRFFKRRDFVSGISQGDRMENKVCSFQLGFFGAEKGVKRIGYQAKIRWMIFL